MNQEQLQALQDAWSLAAPFMPFIGVAAKCLAVCAIVVLGDYLYSKWRK